MEIHSNSPKLYYGFNKNEKVALLYLGWDLFYLANNTTQ